MKSKYIPWLVLVVLAAVLVLAPGATSCIIVAVIVALEMIAWAIYRMLKKHAAVSGKESDSSSS